MTLSRFYDAFRNEDYRLKMETAFNWFLGSNRLHQIIYNPCTGGCYDGLEKSHVNLNQGAESTLSYLLARLTIGTYKKAEKSFTAEKLKRTRIQQKNKHTIYSTGYGTEMDQPYAVPSF